MEKKIFERPKCQVVLFDATDIIATSEFFALSRKAFENTGVVSAAGVEQGNDPEIPTGNG